MNDFARSRLGLFIRKRLSNDRDCKVLITSRGTTTGTGKTTLAIHLARQLTAISADVLNHNRTWKAESGSFMSVPQYLERYKEADTGDILITDEIEVMADNRRSMSNSNVELTQAWQTLRFRNVVTIATAPGMYSVDKRILDNTDIWINVIRQGVAYPYYMTMNDFTGERVKLRFGSTDAKDELYWSALPDDDDDYTWLKEQKEKLVTNQLRDDGDDGDGDDSSQFRRTVAERMLSLNDDNELDLTQAEIANLLDYDQSQISRIKADM